MWWPKVSKDIPAVRIITKILWITWRIQEKQRLEVTNHWLAITIDSSKVNVLLFGIETVRLSATKSTFVIEYHIRCHCLLRHAMLLFVANVFFRCSSCPNAIHIDSKSYFCIDGTERPQSYATASQNDLKDSVSTQIWLLSESWIDGLINDDFLARASSASAPCCICDLDSDKSQSQIESIYERVSKRKREKERRLQTEEMND